MDREYSYEKCSAKPEAYEAVKRTITPELIAKYQVKAELTYEGDNITATGKGFTLSLDFTENTMELTLKLSFLLKPLRGKVIAGIEKQIDRVL